MGVAHNGIERLEVKGEAVLVIGCGPVGLFAMACAKALGTQDESYVLKFCLDFNKLAYPTVFL